MQVTLQSLCMILLCVGISSSLDTELLCTSEEIVISTTSVRHFRTHASREHAWNLSFGLMTLTKLVTDAFGVLTIICVSLTSLLGLLCIYHSLYFQLRIRRRGSPLLSYFNGPRITRLSLILAAIWWGLGEIVRISFLRGRIRLFSSLTWQKDICKFYILSNLGFAEPSMFLILAFLLHAALQKTETGTLSQRWNGRTTCCVLLLCLPLFVMQLVLILVGPKFNNNETYNRRTKMAKFFATASSLTEDNIVCTYPLLSIIILGLFVSFLISYVIYVGARMLSLVINKGLRRRVYLLIFSVVVFLPLRVILLGLSVLPRPGNLVYEVIVFLAFLMLVFYTWVGICLLVYFPVVDSLALRDFGLVEMHEVPYDDYYSEEASLIANQSHLEMERNSDLSIKRGSISFRSITKDEPSTSDGMVSSTLV